MRQRIHDSRNFGRTGLSLLEVLLALAILATVLIAVSPVVDAGLRAAIAAEREAQAVVIAASYLDEIAAGLKPVVSIRQVQSSNHPDFQVDVTAVPDRESGLSAVMVAVSRRPVEGEPLVHVALTRLMRTQRLADTTIGSLREDADR